MNVSMRDYLKAIAPDLPTELVSAETFFEIETLAQMFPPCYLVAFECRLGADESRVDFQVQLPSHLLNLPESLLQSAIWQKLQGFYREWAEPTDSFFIHHTVTALSLEFDLVGQPLLELVPCILLTLNRETVTDAQTLIDIILKLRNFPVSSKLESNVGLCYDSLPPEGRIASVGAMLSRENQALKLGLKGISTQQLLDYLAQIGWQDPTNQLPPLLLKLSEFVDEIGLDVEIGDTVYPRIGLECYFEKQPFSEPQRWEVFLDRLVTRGLCTVAKKDGLLAWPGFTQKADRMELWPSNLIWGDIFMGSKGFSIFSRTIYEIKIVYHPGEPLSAKAYLVFGHDWLDASASNKTEPQKKTENPKIETSQYLERVRNYYDRMNPVILKYVGTTYQASLLKTNSDGDCYRESNLYFAKRAGIKPGDRVLDAGCGVCGPSIDIARTIQSVTIDAITLSPEQAKTARELVRQAGLGDRITVRVGDFHYLPFADRVFDIVFFFGSIGYCYDRQRLFSEVYRVLRPGGNLYIKDPFIKEEALSAKDRYSIAEAEKIYVIKLYQVRELIESIARVGFERITSDDLTSTVSTDRYYKAMVEVKDGNPFLTEFGKYHHPKNSERPTFFGEVKAGKPS